MCTVSTDDSVDLQTHLLTFLHGKDGARDRATPVVETFVSRSVKRVTRGWQTLEPAEVVQEAMLALLASPHRFDAARGSATAFLRQIVREAVRTVRAAYMPAGNRKRQNAARPVVSVPVEDLTVKEVQQFAQARDGSAAAIEARCDVIMLAPQIGRDIALMIMRLAEDEPKIEIAAAFDLDRFALDRRLRRCRRELRLAA
ncbi:MAG: hypothetical protein JO264_07745 [Acidisphaera sp.]|nr:hypothetical protein [Acidisphaera sp.]